MVQTLTSAAIIEVDGLNFIKRSEVKHGSEADPGTSPTATGWDLGLELPECPNIIKNKSNKKREQKCPLFYNNIK